MTGPAAFLRGEGTDGAGRRIAEVLAFDDAALELHHDFIQWLFPLREASRAVAGATVLGEAEVRAIRADPAAQLALTTAAARMLRFYETTKAWHAPFDHNHLRITRIVKSLRLLVGDAAADAFRADVLVMLGSGTPVNDVSLRHWASA